MWQWDLSRADFPATGISCKSSLFSHKSPRLCASCQDGGVGMSVLSDRAVRKEREKNAAPTTWTAGTDITDIIKFYLIQVRGHKGSHNDTVPHLEVSFLLQAPSVIINTRTVHWAWAAAGKLNPGFVRAPNDKLIHIGRKINDSNDNKGLCTGTNLNLLAMS